MRTQFEITATICLVALTGAFICGWKYRTALATGWKRIWNQQPLRLLITGIVAALIAQVCDSYARYPSILLVLEEVLEMNTALAVFLGTLAIHYSKTYLLAGQSHDVKK